MANDQHVAVLNQGVAAWNAWREANPNIRPKLVGADLRMANFRMPRADLAGADFTEAELNEADLYQADLRGANLRGANLTRRPIP